MKVKIFQIRHIKDYIRSLPPNVATQMLMGDSEQSF